MLPASLARWVYRLTAFLALPGGLWAALEMYGFTLIGPQMLFFSIVHTMPLLVFVVLLSIPTGIAWLAQSALALVHAGYRDRLAVPRRPLVVFATFIVAHAVLLVGYDSWSRTSLRVPLCLLGLTLTSLAVREAWVWLSSAKPRQHGPVAESDA
jgi:hypothetical protein